MEHAENATRSVLASGGAGTSLRRDGLVALLIAFGLCIAAASVPAVAPLLYPFRMFATLIHESCHALVALLVGGQVMSVRVLPSGSGVTQFAAPAWSLGLVWSAGYVGAAAFGAAMLQLCRLGVRVARYAIAACGAWLVAVVVLWAHNPLSAGFTEVAGLACGALLIACAWKLPARAVLPTAMFLAVQTCLNSLTDLRVLFNLASAGSGSNDAAFMAQAYGIPAVVWAVGWMALGAVLLGASVRGLWRGMRRQAAA